MVVIVHHAYVLESEHEVYQRCSIDTRVVVPRMPGRNVEYCYPHPLALLLSICL